MTSSVVFGGFFAQSIQLNENLSENYVGRNGWIAWIVFQHFASLGSELCL